VLLAVAGLLAPMATGAVLPEEIVVTATREPAPALTLIGNTARIDGDRLRLVSPTHPAVLGTQAAGTWLVRGSEQESLTAIRSPVLTGPGSCGAFLMLEDGIPIRPVGFCNVNELFEIVTSQAAALEVLRGPSGALYGANGLHGTLNFLLPEPGSRSGFAGSAELGPNHYSRASASWDGAAGAGALIAGITLDNDADFRADAGYEQAKGFVKFRPAVAAGEVEIGFAGTLLDQETAGFIEGKDAYRDPTLRTENLNPEAYRDADSQRLYARWIPAADHALAGADLRAYLRRSEMDFLQHFLPGKPREENGQWSGGLMAFHQRDLGGERRLATGLDLEIARGFLEEFQGGDSGQGTIPPGKHYDYDARSYLAAPFTRIELPIAPAWTLAAGLRAEYMLYEYDNRMLDGNTRGDGTPCTPAPCRFSRPADRNDSFFNVAPDLGLLWRISPALAAYGRVTRGFRPPQAAELYRLQAQQDVADLDSETLDSAELGLHWQSQAIRLELVSFAMKKRDFIFQDASRFNVSNGKTRHLGVELQADLRLPSGPYGGFAGTYAKQTYAFSSATPGGERIRTGDDIDTAPRTLASARLGYDHPVALAELEWTHVGSHYLDVGNLTTYGGHNLLNLRGVWRVTPALALTLRVNNLADEFYAERADFAFGTYRYFPGRDREMYLEVAWSSQ
jgi:outer membrane receptor protein involved in Fe transport